MTISEILTVLGKIQQYAGDLPAVLTDVETGAEHVLQDIDIHLTPAGDPASIHMKHGPAGTPPDTSSAEPSAETAGSPLGPAA